MEVLVATPPEVSVPASSEQSASLSWSLRSMALRSTSRHPVVHNEHVVGRLEAVGAVTVDGVSAIPESGTAVWPSRWT